MVDFNLVLKFNEVNFSRSVNLSYLHMYAVFILFICYMFHFDAGVSAGRNYFKILSKFCLILSITILLEIPV